VFALVVGIDEVHVFLPREIPMCLIIQQYASDEIFNLSGCINDANSIVGFLSRRLHVTDSNIICLTNASATRNAIISKFQDHLLYNEDILYGDTIIFFYAGHGMEMGGENWLIPIDAELRSDTR